MALIDCYKLPAAGINLAAGFVLTPQYQHVTNQPIAWMGEGWNAEMFEELTRTGLEKIRSKRQSNKKPKDKYWMRSAKIGQEASFRCLGCRAWVQADALLSGVQNRNHCPYCLASRHLDLDVPGDRLSVCKTLMTPVGLTLKKTGKKYGPAGDGELMLVHCCQGCGKLSLNRIAADDDPEKLLALLELLALQKEAEWPAHDYHASSITLLSPVDRSRVRRLLYGGAPSD